MNRFVKHLLADKNRAGSHYSSIHVVMYTEDIAQKAYNGWYCKNVSTQSATREIKGMEEFDKLATIYDGMCQIGWQSQAVQNKG